MAENNDTNVEYVDLTNDMLSIENMFNVVDESIATMNDLDKSISIESSIPDSLKEDKHVVMLSIEHINTLRASVGLPKNVTTSNVDTIDLSIEEKVGLFKKIILAIKKMYLKIVAAIKKFVVKLVNNGKVLDKRLKELKDNINPNAKPGSIDIKENLRLENYFATILDVYRNLDLNDTYKIIEESMSVIDTYKSISEVTEAVTIWTRDEEKANEEDNPLTFAPSFIDNMNKREATENEFKNKALHILIISYSVQYKDSGIDDKSKNKGVIIRADGDTLEGLIEVPDKDGVKEYVLYKTKNTINIGSGSTFTTLAPNDMLNIINKIGTPSKAIDNFWKLGKKDIKAGDGLIKIAEELGNNPSASHDGLSKFVTMILNLIPRVVNSNVIGYYNTINNIIKTLEIHNKYLIKE